MIEYINSIEDLNQPNLENAMIMLILAADKDNYDEILSYVEFIEYPEFIISLPKRDDDLERTRRRILAEINRRCEKTPVSTTDSFVVFRIKDGKANFRPKRTIHCAGALRENIANDMEELINIIAHAASKSFEDIDKLVKQYIDTGTFEGTFGVELGTNAEGMVTVKPTAGVKLKEERKSTIIRIITK